MPIYPKNIPKRSIFLLSLILFFCLPTVPGFAANSPPSVGTISPSSGYSNINQTISFTTTYYDPNGYTNIQYVCLLINTSASGANCFYGYYVRSTNKLYLRNDTNTGWLGGYAPGSSGRYIENSYVKLDCYNSRASASGTTLSVKWAVIFKNTFIGSKKSYLYVKDNSNAYNGWTQKGTYTIDTISPTGSIKVNNDSQYSNSSAVTLNLTASDNSGGSGIDQMKFSNDNSTWSAAESYNPTKAWLLSSGDSTKTVYAKFSDKSGNWSNSYSDTIILDTTPPKVIITSPQSGIETGAAQVQLQGTVDGVSFSENRTLTTEGQNTLTKTATDAAGNSGSGSVNISFYQSTEIGASGGEVASSDGKVRLIVPSGALNETKYIKLSNVNNDSLNSATPTNKSLLSVVECKPAGLVFNKSASIIYTLSLAEIPGTPVELGLYDSSQRQIISTGQTSIVPSDGYTVTFSISHFSTYAALKSLTSQGTPIGAGVKIPLPDMLTGSFSHSIPITVVHGRKGMQPNIALTYRSSNPDSWTGVGFSLNPGYIVRSTRLGPPTYTDNDTFYFITDSGSTELVHLIDNLYQAKIESGFARFYKETDDSWKIVGKDGSILRLGTTSDSKETSSSGTFSWHITRATDTNGNYIQFSYNKDQGKSYLSRIDYTGNDNGVAPRNSIEFILEAREDIPSSYLSGSKIATAKRLKEIQVKVNSELVWRYSLEYNYSADTNRSLLKSVTQSASDNTSLPKQTLTYQQAR
jgi:hypothetical protein